MAVSSKNCTCLFDLLNSSLQDFKPVMGAKKHTISSRTCSEVYLRNISKSTPILKSKTYSLAHISHRLQDTKLQPCREMAHFCSPSAHRLCNPAPHPHPGTLVLQPQLLSGDATLDPHVPAGLGTASWAHYTGAPRTPKTTAALLPAHSCLRPASVPAPGWLCKAAKWTAVAWTAASDGASRPVPRSRDSHSLASEYWGERRGAEEGNTH